MLQLVIKREENEKANRGELSPEEKEKKKRQQLRKLKNNEPEKPRETH